MPNCLEELFYSNTFHFRKFERVSYFYIAIELSSVGCSPSYILLTPYVQPKLKDKLKEVCNEKQVNHSALCVSRSENEKSKKKNK